MCALKGDSRQDGYTSPTLLFAMAIHRLLIYVTLKYIVWSSVCNVHPWPHSTGKKGWGILIKRRGGGERHFTIGLMD